ncbi:hypothetical protein NESM_000645600 [Novymonas esmeraldas]|uniref:Uncharacterized protein n=1 Tax=Novymonas esmeraldas TaxID=1808958 RepID=A0AAW0ESK0_9TRYP
MAPKTRSSSSSAKVPRRGRSREAAHKSGPAPDTSAATTEAAERTREAEQRAATTTGTTTTTSKAHHGTTAAAEPVASPASPWRHRHVVFSLAAVVAALFVGAALLVGSRESGGDHGVLPERHPCSCAVPEIASSRLAQVLLSRRSGVSGVHWRTDEPGLDAFSFVSKCGRGAVVVLPGSFETVDELRAALVAPPAGQRGGCTVWVTTPEAVTAVANALKELLENNALTGRTVVPAHSRATLVVRSPKSREELKAELPHRVVHMLTEV